MVDRNTQIRGEQIKDGSISEAKLDISNSPVDGYLLRYNTSESKFEWVSGNDGVTEYPVGLINSTNQSYTITDTPQAETLHLYLNGVYQDEGSGKDYQLSGKDITFVIAPDTGDNLIASYIKAIAGASLAHEQDTDQYLDKGGVNESTAVNVKDAVDNKHAHANSVELDLVSDGDHDVRSDNPHSVDKSDVSLGNVDNINVSNSAIEYVIDGGDLEITTGIKAQLEIPFDCTITDVVLIGDVVGSIVIDLKRSTYAGFPTTVSIAASAKPTLSSSQKSNDSTLTGWNTALTAGDILEYVVDSASTVTRVLVSLKVDRT